MKIKLRDATGQQIHDAFEAGCAENVRFGACLSVNCPLKSMCGTDPNDWNLDIEIEVKGKGKRTQANILLKRVYDLSRSVPSIPCTQPIFEDIEDYLVYAGIAELNEATEEMEVTEEKDSIHYRWNTRTETDEVAGCDTCNQETIRRALIISGHNYCDQCGKELRRTINE